MSNEHMLQLSRQICQGAAPVRIPALTTEQLGALINHIAANREELHAPQQH